MNYGMLEIEKMIAEMSIGDTMTIEKNGYGDIEIKRTLTAAIQSFELSGPPIEAVNDEASMKDLLHHWMEQKNVCVEECDREAAKPLFDAAGLEVDDYI